MVLDKQEAQAKDERLDQRRQVGDGMGVRPEAVIYQERQDLLTL